jgi:hypothetical protein
MADAKRPYTSLAIEDLVALYRAHSDDLNILSHLVQELSFRTTPKERQLLAFAAERLAELEPEPAGPENNPDALLLATVDEGDEDPVITRDQHGCQKLQSASIAEPPPGNEAGYGGRLKTLLGPALDTPQTLSRIAFRNSAALPVAHRHAVHPGRQRSGWY